MGRQFRRLFKWPRSASLFVTHDGSESRLIGVPRSDAFDANGYIEKVFERMFSKSTAKGELHL